MQQKEEVEEDCVDEKVKIPYSNKNDLRIFKEKGLEIIEQICKDLLPQNSSDKEIEQICYNYKKRLKGFLSSALKQYRDHIEIYNDNDLKQKEPEVEILPEDAQLAAANAANLQELKQMANNYQAKKQKVTEYIQQIAKQVIEKSIVKENEFKPEECKVVISNNKEQYFLECLQQLIKEKQQIYKQELARTKMVIEFQNKRIEDQKKNLKKLVTKVNTLDSMKALNLL